MAGITLKRRRGIGGARLGRLTLMGRDDTHARRQINRGYPLKNEGFRPFPMPDDSAPRLPEMAVSIRGLVKRYSQKGAEPKLALDHVDLDIPRGEIFGLLGPNGAGKSTLINIMAQLVIKTEGKVAIWGIDLDQDPRHVAAAIGIVPQELNIDPFF